MPRALITVLFALATIAALTGCTIATPAPAQVENGNTAESAAWSALQEWLNLQQEVTGMATEEVVVELVRVDKPENSSELLYFGLLNQQLQTYGGWTQARDAFRELQQDVSLAVQQRQLAGIWEQYNQNRINWYQRQAELLKQHAELQQQLADTEQEKLQLQQKIQALTDLETVISTRKEQ